MKAAIKILPMHLLVTLFVAPISVVLFTNIFDSVASEMNDSHDNGIKLDYVVETVADMKHSIDENLPKLATMGTRISVVEVEIKHLVEQKGR